MSQQSIIWGVLWSILFFLSSDIQGTKWGDCCFTPGKGTVLRFYPQDRSVQTDESTLTCEEKHFFASDIKDGPSDNEMGIVTHPVCLGDINQTPLWNASFDSISTFSITRLTADMWRGTLEWLSRTFPLEIKIKKVVDSWDTIPHGFLEISPWGIGEEANAYYARKGEKAKEGCELRFGYFTTNDSCIYTCRSADIVSHETGHYALDRMRPDFYESSNLQTGAFHEAFGDISALNFILSNHTMLEALINATKGALYHTDNFASCLAEEFGVSLGMHGYLRDANNLLKLSQVENEVHAMSEVFTGAYYAAITSAFQEVSQKSYPQSDFVTLLKDVAEYGRNLFLHATACVKKDPSFVDIAESLYLSARLHGKRAPRNVSYLKDLKWENYFRKELTLREITLSPTELHHARGITKKKISAPKAYPHLIACHYSPGKKTPSKGAIPSTRPSMPTAALF